jgi:hypothetical protein
MLRAPGWQSTFVVLARRAGSRSGCALPGGDGTSRWADRPGAAAGRIRAEDTGFGAAGASSRLEPHPTSNPIATISGARMYVERITSLEQRMLRKPIGKLHSPWFICGSFAAGLGFACRTGSDDEVCVLVGRRRLSSTSAAAAPSWEPVLPSGTVEAMRDQDMIVSLIHRVPRRGERCARRHAGRQAKRVPLWNEETSLVNERIQLHAVTRAQRHAATLALREAFVQSSGFILDVNLFSNISLNLAFEIPASERDALVRRLDEAQIRLDADSRARIADANASPLTGTLEVTFLHSEPDLRRKVPRVPG